MLSQYRQFRKQLAWINHAREIGAQVDQLGETVFNLPSKQDDEESLANRARFEYGTKQRDLLLESMEADIPWFAKILPIK